MVTKSNPSNTHTHRVIFRRGEEGELVPSARDAELWWHSGATRALPPAVPGSQLRAPAAARRAQTPSPASSHDSALSLSLIELKLFTLITQHGSKFPSRTRGVGELFDPLPRRCLSIQPLALEGWITRPSLFPVNYSR